MGKSYTNIAGGEFKPWVDKQIKLRQEKLDSKKRDEETLQFSTNRNAWYRVTSMSVLKDENPLVKKYGQNLKGDGLAKEFVLQGGVIKRNSNDLGIKLRSGVGRGVQEGIFTQSSYGAIEPLELGYKPMPGITNLSIGTGGKLGVLQEVKIDFKCYNLAQLEIIETLYMKLGFSVFIEWGHTNYFRNDGKFERNPLPLDPWKYDKKVDLLKAIQDKKVQESGNWGGLFGTIKNFNWTVQKDGSYDCKIEVVGAGDILESLRSNQNSEKARGLTLASSFSGTSSTVVEEDANDSGGAFSSDQTKYLPSVVAQRYASTFENVLYSLYEYGIANYEDQKSSWGDVPAPNVIKTTDNDSKGKGYVKMLSDIFGDSPYKFIKFEDSGELKSPTLEENRDEYLASRGNSYQAIREIYDDAYEDIDQPRVIPSNLFNLYTGAFNPNGEGARQIDADDDFDDEGKPMVFITLGHLLAIMNIHCNIFYGKDKKNTSPYILIDFHPDYTFCNTSITQFAVDPAVCLIPFRDKGGLLGIALQDVVTPGSIKALTSVDVTFEDAAIAGELQNPGASTLSLFLKSFDFSDTSGNNAAAAFLERINPFSTNENVKKAKHIAAAADALKRIEATEDDDVNKVTAVLNENNPFYDAENPKRGKLMDVLVNVNFVSSTLSRLKGSEGNLVSTAELLNEILKGISKNLGDINEFRLYPDDETNVLRILDDKVIEPSKVKYTELRIFGLGNTIYDYSYSSKISNELATQIVVASQAQPEGINEDDFAFSHLAQGIEDRIQPVKVSPNINGDGEPANNEDPTGGSPLTSLVDHLRQTYCVMQYDSNSISSALDTARKFFNQLLTADPSNRGQTLIPLDFSLTMDGLTGLIPHQAFIIDRNRLPDTYRLSNGSPRIAFILHSIHHDFSNNKWVTQIKGQTLNIDFEAREAEQQAFDQKQQELDKASQPKPKPTNNNSIPKSTVLQNNAGSGASGEFFPAGCSNVSPPKEYPKINAQGYEDYKGVRIYYGSGKLKSPSTQEFQNVKLIIDACTDIGYNAAGTIGVLSVVAKESSFIPKEESMLYSLSRAREIFGSRIPSNDNEALKYIPSSKGGSGSPEKFANLVYANRSGNGPAPDGWNYRGKGFNQLTFKESYIKYGKLRNKYFSPPQDLSSNPDLLLQPWYAAQMTAVFLMERLTKSQNVNPGEFPDVETAIVHVSQANRGNAKSIPCNVRDVGDEEPDDKNKRAYYNAKRKGSVYFDLAP